MPEKFKEWFDEGEEVFQCLRGASHSVKLGTLLKERGTSISQFYRKVVRAAYTKRLAGEEHLESYHLERDIGEVQGLLLEKQTKEDEEAERRRNEEGEVERLKEEERRKKEEEQHLEDVRKLLTPGELITMHRDGNSQEGPVMQLIAKKVVEEKLVSMTLSDGSHVSENFFPWDDNMGKAITEIKKYDLIKITGASIEKSKIFLHAIEHLQKTDKEGKYVAIKAPVKSNGVITLRKIRQEALDTWGVLHSSKKRIEVRTVDEDQNTTLMDEDPFMMRGGKRQSNAENELSEGQQVSKRSKRNLESCAFCVRTFADKETLRKHMVMEHYD